MRTPMVAGNWKMNTTLDEAKKLVSDLKPLISPIGNVERVVCPPFISIPAVRDILAGSPIKTGAQNVYFQDKGAYTGEISPMMLSGLCEYIVIGHSERRQYFGETGDIINKKLAAAVKAGLKPILCVGERLEDNEKGLTRTVITDQLNAALDGLNGDCGLVVAYEPVWAIGTGRAATGQQANDTIGFIRQCLVKYLGATISSGTRILYGGSVTAENTTEFMKQPEIDGSLVGGASLKADQFSSIVRQTSAAKL